MTDKKTLYGKLARIAGDIERVDKDGKNKHFNYSYAKPETVMRALKPLLAAHSIAIIPSITDIKQTQGEKNIRTCIHTVYTIVDGESGEEFTATWAGEAQDNADKGISKAETVALRTFLLQLFQIPAEDPDTDPDHANYSEPREQPKQRSRNGSSKKPAPPVEQPESEQQQLLATLVEVQNELKERGYKRQGDEPMVGVKSSPDELADAITFWTKRLADYEQMQQEAAEIDAAAA